MDGKTPFFRRIITGFLACLMLLSLVTIVAADEESPVTDAGNQAQKENDLQGNGGDYTDNVYVANRLDVVFSEFPVGAFFSYTGRPCTCHNKCSYYGGCDCISDYNDPEKGGKLVRLYSVQCMGFAHYVFYKLFGFIDSISYPENASKYYSLGSLSPSQMTLANVKKLFEGAKTGANIRVLGKHSMIVLKTNEEGIYVFQGNWVSPCMINIKFWTWEEFASRYKPYGIEYVNMPVNYPESSGEYVPPEVKPSPGEHFAPGMYRVTAGVGLRLRAGAGVTYPQLSLIPDKTVVRVTEVDSGWGKTVYNELDGWIFLEYTDPITTPLTELQVTIPAGREIVYLSAPPDFSGLTVTAHYTDGREEPLEPGTYALTYSFPAPGNYTVTVASGGIETSFEVTARQMGDLNGDGQISAADVLPILRAAEGSAPPDAPLLEGADLNEDGKVDRADAELLLGYLTGNVAALPAKGGTE